MESLNPLFLLALFGVGLTQGLLGAGGGVLCIPLMLHGLQDPMPQAIANSLAIVASLSWLGVLFDRSWLYWRTFLPVLLCSALSCGLTSMFLLPLLPESLGSVPLLDLTYFLQAFFLALSGLLLLLSPTFSHKRHSHSRLLLLAAIVGALTAFIGASGGILLLPSLILFGHMSPHVASMVSLSVIAVDSSVALLLSSYAPTLPHTAYAVAAFGMALGRSFSPLCPKTLLMRIMGLFLIALAFILNL